MGAYTVLGRIGEGGMGVVYFGRAPDGRQVAIKVVRPELARDAGFVARFEDEVANAQRVASFCTARVLDHGVSDERAYMVTEYIDGLSLKDYVKQNGDLSLGMLQGVAIGVAAALAAIHAAGLIHRDLKPANVMLSYSGPRVIDFGIARALDVASGLTMTGQLVGSPGWMAPERILQQEVTTAVDIFSWGCLVAFAQSGANPFGTGDFSVMSARLVHGEPQVGPLPPPLDRLVRAALDKDPRNRPTARELLLTMIGGESNEAAVLSTLNDWQSPDLPQGGTPAAGDPPQNRQAPAEPPPGWAPVAGERGQDRPGQSGPPPGNRVPVAYGSDPAAGPGRPPAPGAPAGAGHTVAAGPPSAPERTLAAGPPAGPERTLAAGRPGGSGTAGSGAPERTVAAGSGALAGAGRQEYGPGHAPGGTTPLGPPTMAAGSPAESPTMAAGTGTRPPRDAPPFSPSGPAREKRGRNKAVLAGAVALVLAGAAVGGWLILKPSGDHPVKDTAASAPAGLPSDALLVRLDRQSGWPKQCYGSIGKLLPSTRTASKVFADDNKCDILPRWSHDRKQIAFTRSSGAVTELWIMNADGSGARRVTDILDGRSRVAWSPDDKKIAVVAKTSAGRQIAAITLADPQAPPSLLTHDSAMKDDPVWCRGRVGFWSMKNGTQQVYTLDVAKPSAPWVQVTHAAHNANDPAFSPNCTMMAYTEQPTTDARHIWTSPADGTGTPRQLTPDNTRDMDANYSPDGGWIAVARGASAHQSIWAMRVDGSGARQISSGDLGVAQPSWS